MYRDKQKLRSCDAYYENTQRKDYLAIEFKNTSHFRLKAFFGEIEEAKNNFSGKFAREFFAETGFIDKTEFVEDYINADCFNKMTEIEIVEQ